MNKERIQKKLERASERERRRNKKPEFKSKRRRGQRSCSYRFKKEMVSSTGEGEFASVSLTAPSRAFADYAGTLARASSIAHWQLRDLVCCASNPCASVPSSSASSSSTRSQRSSDASAYDPQLFVVRHCSTLQYSIRDRKVRFV